MVAPNTLARDISPPPTRKPPSNKLPSKRDEHVAMQSTSKQLDSEVASGPSLAAIEAGEAHVRDHLAYFSKYLSLSSRETPSTLPRIAIDKFQDLYRRNQRPHGCHFVIHQHDHPISGVHYDLRLQFSQTSTISFAVPYGLPGNPNTVRPNRMAIETRVHNLWNNLIESASHATGSLLIWDTGEYEVLPYREPTKARTTDDELSDSEVDVSSNVVTESEKLFAAFQAKHVRLRLHGARLPKGYTVSLRLPSANDRDKQPKKPQRKRRRLDPSKVARRGPPSTDSESETEVVMGTTAEDKSVISASNEGDADVDMYDAALASEADDEDSAIRSNNAYTGATNSIGSVHQRYWFLSLDRANSGFRKARSGPDAGRWIGDGDSKPFVVLGRDVERSVVTGRSADEVMADEGVKRFQGRKMWRAITE